MDAQDWVLGRGLGEEQGLKMTGFPVSSPETSAQRQDCKPYIKGTLKAKRTVTILLLLVAGRGCTRCQLMSPESPRALSLSCLGAGVWCKAKEDAPTWVVGHSGLAALTVASLHGDRRTLQESHPPGQQMQQGKQVPGEELSWAPESRSSCQDPTFPCGPGDTHPPLIHITPRDGRPCWGAGTAHGTEPAWP